MKISFLIYVHIYRHTSRALKELGVLKEKTKGEGMGGVTDTLIWGRKEHHFVRRLPDFARSSF